MNTTATTILSEGYFRWRCRRGMKELDFILNRYLDAKFDQMNDATKQLFDDTSPLLPPLAAHARVVAVMVFKEVAKDAGLPPSSPRWQEPWV